MADYLGTGQSLSSSNFSLALTRCSFEPTAGDSAIGYSRKVISEPTVEYALYGSGFVRGMAYVPRFQFDWNLQLSDTELETLMLLYSEQQKAIATRTASSTITLTDTYLPLLESGTASKSVASTITSTASYIKYYAIYQIVITSQPQYEWFYNGLWKVKLGAVEFA